MENPALPDRAAVRIFPPAAPVITIAAGILLQNANPLAPDLEFAGWVRVVGALIVAGAIGALGAWSVLLMRRTGQSENPWKPTTSLVIRGPFRISRNPMYLQMVVGCIGFSLALGNLWILALTPLSAIALHFLAIKPEEAYLERKFGAAYREYAARVRRWL